MNSHVSAQCLCTINSDVMFQFDKKTQYISDSTNEINGLIFQIV